MDKRGSALVSAVAFDPKTKNEPGSNALEPTQAYLATGKWRFLRKPDLRR